MFCVDISPRALETGFAEACFKAVEAALDAVPGGERARVGLMTFDRSLNVYRFDSEGAVSQTVVAVDTEVRRVMQCCLQGGGGGRGYSRAACYVY